MRKLCLSATTEYFLAYILVPIKDHLKAAGVVAGHVSPNPCTYPAGQHTMSRITNAGRLVHETLQGVFCFKMTSTGNRSQCHRSLWDVVEGEI